MLVSAVLTFLGLSYFAAPYGKYSASKGFGPLVPAQLAWAFMECPNLWVSALVWFYRRNLGGAAIDNTMNQVALFCFLLHYTNRSIIYPLRMSASKTTPMPLSVMMAALVFCTWNGLNQALSLVVEGNDVLANSKITDPRCLLGLAVFLFGFYTNITSDNTLIRAKMDADAKAAAGTGGGSKYVIPRGGMFTYVSCANYCKCALHPDSMQTGLSFRKE